MISVVIPLYNKEKSIVKTIDSVLNQTYKDFEIIIINDGSTDNSFQKATSINDIRIKTISQINKGVSSARNEGVNNAKYDLIALLDGDDLWQVNFLEEMLKLTQDLPEASLYGCASYFKWPNRTTTDSTFGLPYKFRNYINDYFEIACENTLFNSSSVILRKTDFLKLGMFNNNLSKGEDIDLWIRFGLNSKIAFYNIPLTIYNLNAEERTGNKIINKSKSLIWNLNKYYKIENDKLKIFLDNWKLAHVSNYLKGTSTEIDEPYTLLREIKYAKLSMFYKILIQLPKFLHRPFFQVWQIRKSA